jgi:hypothetical protein
MLGQPPMSGAPETRGLGASGRAALVLHYGFGRLRPTPPSRWSAPAISLIRFIFGESPARFKEQP